MSFVSELCCLCILPVGRCVVAVCVSFSRMILGLFVGYTESGVVWSWGGGIGFRSLSSIRKDLLLL